MKLFTIPIFLGLLSLPVFAQDVSLRDARVTIPYEELKSLLAKAGREKAGEEEAPPVPAILAAAEYRLDFSGGKPVLSARVEVRGFAGGWHSVPLFGGSPRLVSEESTEEVSLVSSAGGYSMMARGEGVFSSTMVLTVPPRSDLTRGNAFEFSPAPATRNELRVVGLAEDETLVIEGVDGFRDESNELVFSLPGDGMALRLYLDERREPAPVAPITESDWTLHSQVAARYEDGRLHQEARIQAQAGSGSGLSMSLAFPPHVSRLEIEGDDLRDWTLEPREDEERVARIFWKTRDTLDRTLTLRWETPQSPLADAWTLAPPVALAPEGAAEREGEASRTLFALLPVEGLELDHPGLVATVEPQRLPGWLRDRFQGAESLSAEIVGANPVSLAATWLPRMETAQATISLARFETQLVEDGSTLVTADYQVQHGAPLTWSLSLPSAEQILACEINDVATNPIQREENEVEFRLSAPREIREDEEGIETVRGTSVRLCYALRSDPLDPVSGRVALELPQTELFIHRLEWALRIPELYEPTAVEGNVRISTGKGEGGSIRLEKELCRGERPAVELYYQRRDVNS